MSYVLKAIAMGEAEGGGGQGGGGMGWEGEGRGGDLRFLSGSSLFTHLPPCPPLMSHSEYGTQLSMCTG